MKHILFISLTLALTVFLAVGCKEKTKEKTQITPNEAASVKTAADTKKIRVIFDTDANNELDDQHALAYLLFNGDVFEVVGVTVNATRGGGDVDSQYAEAFRVMQLCTLDGKIPLLKGANGIFSDIDPGNDSFDGADAVNFMIENSTKNQDEKTILLAVGKLTNVALALKKAPEMIPNVKVVWLGSNYPEPGEYNQENDTTALNYLLKTDVEFEMVTVRYGTPSGTAAVSVTQSEINETMPGKGPQALSPVEGRHGESFSTFGDYSINLFEHIDYHGDPPSRALFDMAAVAIVKNQAWAEKRKIPCPTLLSDGTWVEKPDNTRTITVWENFARDEIMTDFYDRLNNYVLAGKDAN
ncbi:MAG: nucleoside hydrolase [Cyclobacteriaceae bacterium]|nr:nucleoside hydrolase [Cyclobacteriaceae bacterium]